MLHMPVPPSLNKLWISTARGRVRSQAYRDWAAAAGWEVRRQFLGTPALACRYDMILHVPISLRDTGNWEKGIGDLLESVGVVSNDGNCNRLEVVPEDRADVLVVLTPLPEMGAVRPPAARRGGRGNARRGGARPAQSKLKLVARLRAGGIRL